MHTKFYVILIYVYIKKTLTLKAYNKLRKATDIISQISSERRCIFNASQWSKLSNVTSCFTACKGAHSPAAEMDNRVRFNLRSGSLYGVSRPCATAPNNLAVSAIVSFKTSQGLEC